MTLIKNCELLPHQWFFLMCRLIQLEEFHRIKDREIEQMRVRCVVFHDSKLSFYRAHNRQAVHFQISFQEMVDILH